MSQPPVLNGLNPDLGKGGAGLARNGEYPYDLFSYLVTLGGTHAPAQPSTAALAAMAVKDLTDGMRTVDVSTGKRWRYSASSAAVDPTFILAIAVTAGGAWLLDATSADIKLPVGFATVDAAVLFTVPVGFKLRIARVYRENAVPWTGGASAAIGASSSNAGYNTRGDLLGGSAGDLAAALVAGYGGGMIGSKFSSNGVIVLVAGDTIRHDRITSAFTAGSGFVHVQADLIN